MISDLVTYLDEIIMPISYSSAEITESLRLLNEIRSTYDLSTLLDAPSVMYHGKKFQNHKGSLLKRFLMLCSSTMIRLNKLE